MATSRKLQCRRGVFRHRVVWSGFAILFVVVVLVSSHSLIVLNTISRQAEVENRAANLAQAETAARFVGDEQQALLRLLTVIASRPSLQRALELPGKDPLQPYLRPIVTMGTRVSAAFLTDPGGHYLERLSATSSNEPLLPDPAFRHEPAVPAVNTSLCGGGTLCFVLSVPVPGTGDKVLGHIGAVLSADYWHDFLARLSARPARTLFLFDRAGKLVTADLSRAQTPAVSLAASAAEVRKRLSTATESWAGILSSADGRDRFFAAAALVPQSNWAVIVLQEYKAAMSATHTLSRNIFLFLCLLVCSLIFLGVLLVSRYQAQERQLESLDGQARRLEALVQERTADLELSIQRYLNLVQDLPDIVYELDQNDRFTFVSNAVTAVLGYKPEEMLGHTHREFVLAEDRPKYDELKARTEHGQPMSISALRHRAADGSERWLSVHSRAVEDGRGRILGRRGVAHDVTQQVLAEQQIHALSGQLIIAQEEERKRLALDLHDEMGQLLSALKIGLQTLARTHLSARPDIDRLIRLTQEAMDRSRNLAYRLRPAILDNFGLTAAVEDLCESLSEDGVVRVDYQLDHIDDRLLGPAVKTTLFRFVQEALTNVVKHAASPRAEVRLTAMGNHIRAQVRDFGVGFDVENVLRNGGGRRLGLLGMQERLHLVGGRLSIKSSNRGTLLVAEVPLGGRP